MKIFPRKSKSVRGSGNFYFGDYGEIPIGLSQTKITRDNIENSKDTLHFHKKGNEFYLTLEGEAIIEVEGKETLLTEDKLIMVEHGEKHYVKKVTKTPFKVLSICTTKDPDDKVIA